MNRAHLLSRILVASSLSVACGSSGESSTTGELSSNQAGQAGQAQGGQAQGGAAQAGTGGAVAGAGGAVAGAGGTVAGAGGTVAGAGGAVVVAGAGGAMATAGASGAPGLPECFPGFGGCQPVKVCYDKGAPDELCIEPGPDTLQELFTRLGCQEQNESLLLGGASPPDSSCCYVPFCGEGRPLFVEHQWRFSALERAGGAWG